MKSLQQQSNLAQQNQKPMSTIPNEFKAKELVKNIMKTISQYSAQFKRLRNGMLYGKLINQVIASESSFLYDTGEFYYGQFSKCKFHGYGVFIFQNGSILKGQFVDGMIHGFGQIEFTNRDIVRGYFDKGEFIGERIKFNHKTNQWTFKKYGDSQQLNKIQNFEEILRKSIEDPFFFDQLLTENLQGYKLNRLDQSVSIGNRELGCYIICRKDFFNVQIGSFNESMRLDLKGKIFFQNGDIYDGNFKDQKFHGKGVYFNGKDNNWIIGIFDENQIKEIIQNASSYPPPQYNTIFKDQEKLTVDFALTIERNVISNKLLLKCLFGKNNQLYQNIQNINSLQIVVPSDQSLENPLHKSFKHIQIEQNHQMPLQDQNKIEKSKLLTQQQDDNLKLNSQENNTRVKVGTLFYNNAVNSKDNEQLQKENIGQKEFQKNTEFTSLNELNLQKNHKLQFQKLDEIIESKNQKLCTQPNLNNSYEIKSCLKQSIRQQNQSASQATILQTFLKLDQPEYKQINRIQNSPTKLTIPESQILKFQQQQLNQKSIDQQLQIKVIENTISKSIQNIKPISQLQSFLSTQNPSKHLNPEDEAKFESIYSLGQSLKKTQSCQQQQSNQKKINNYFEQRNGGLQVDRPNHRVMQTEANISRENSNSQNQRSRIQTSVDKQTSLRVHMRNHSETIQTMLQKRDSSQHSRNNSAYKSPLLNPNDKDFLYQQGVQEIVLSNHTHLFTRANSISNMKQSNDFSAQKERSISKNQFQLYQQEKQPQKYQQPNLEKRQNSSTDLNRLTRANSYLHVRLANNYQNKLPVDYASTAYNSQNKIGTKETTLSAKLINKQYNDVNIQKQLKIANPPQNTFEPKISSNKIIYK